MYLEPIKQSAFSKFKSQTLSNTATIIGGRYKQTGAGSIVKDTYRLDYCCDAADDEGQKEPRYYGGRLTMK